MSTAEADADEADISDAAGDSAPYDPADSNDSCRR